MAAPTTAQKWRATMRRLFGRPTPYWRTRVGDEHEPPMVGDVGYQITGQVMLLFVLAFVLLATAYLSLIVFVAPGGLAGVIGAQLAEVCRSTGQCDLRYLLAGYAFAWVLVLGACEFLFITIIPAVSNMQGQEETETERALAFIDERIVQLRTDLVTSGILTVPAEERKDEGD